MKRFWIGIFLIIFSIGLCVTEHNLTKNTTGEIKTTLNELSVALEEDEYEAAWQINTELNSSWRRYQKPLAIFVSHTPLSEMSETLGVFESELKNEEYEQLDENLALAGIKILEIEDNEKLTITNLL